MAKALFGHVGIGPDLRLVAEVRRLRARVRELEEDLRRARQDAVTATVDDEFRRLSDLPDTEPALT